mgnify:FL=1
MFRATAHPYERRACLWLDEWGRTTFAVGGSMLLSSPAWLCLHAAVVLGHPWYTLSLFAAAGLYLAHRGGWMGAFAWADLGPEECGREVLTGVSHNTNMFPPCTKESYNGGRAGGYGEAEDAWIVDTYNREKWAIHLPWERSGPLGYRWAGPGEWTWAQRVHHRHVLPRLRARGVPGY